jgi:hypothetical protein
MGRIGAIMRAKQFLAALLVAAMVLPGLGWTLPAGAQSPPPAPPAAAPDADAAPAAPGADVTPARISYLNGEVSFWRPGAAEWAPARLNTPLAPGDVFYTGDAGTVELQLAPRAFVRAAPGTHLALDNQEPDFVQLRLTAGHAALDMREVGAGHTVELATPGGAFTVEKAGYYPVDVSAEATVFRAHRGGAATVTPAGGIAAEIAANQQVKLVGTGTETPRVESAAAPALSAWDRWNYQRTDYLIQPASAQHVGTNVYGAEELDRHGTWRTVETYGSVWVPTNVAPGWVPYSTGRWIWDPRFGWTWLDDAPWGWAPYHYGRWVHVRNYWAWAPGPIVVRPFYAPALVVFLGGVTVSVGSPVYWAPLYWGEPIVPWWGRPGFVGVATWRGWGGPRVVNNVVVRNTTVNVTNVNYRNVTVSNAVVGVSADRFGRGQAQVQRVSNTQARELRPVRDVRVRPVAASLAPASGAAVRPPTVVETRPVVATRAPRDVRPTLESQGLPAASPAVTPAPAPRIVPAPSQSVRRAAAPEPRGNRDGAPGQGRGTPRVGTPEPAPRPGGDATSETGSRERRRDVDRTSPAPAGPAPTAPPAPGVSTNPRAPAPGGTVTPAPPAPRVTNQPPAAVPSGPPAPAAPAPAPPAPNVRRPAPTTPPTPNAREQAPREQERPEPRATTPRSAPTPNVQQAPQPGGTPGAPPRVERPDRSERPGRPETPRARMEPPAPAPSAPRPEARPERVQQERAPRPEPRPERVQQERAPRPEPRPERAQRERAPRPEPRPERVQQERAPRIEPRQDRGTPVRGQPEPRGPERRAPERGGSERERSKPAA